MATYASGKHAFGFCDRCGFRYDLSELKPEIENQRPNGLKVCWVCFDVDHPQLQLGKFPINDPIVLKDPRPDRALGRGLFGWAPVGDNAMTIIADLGTVFVRPA